MTDVLCDLKRIVIPGGYIAFEVGEVRGGKYFSKIMSLDVVLRRV